MIQMLFRLEKKDAPDPLLVSRPMNWTVLHASGRTIWTCSRFRPDISPARVKVMLQSLSKAGRDPLHVASYRKPEVVQFLPRLVPTGRAGA